MSVLDAGQQRMKRKVGVIVFAVRSVKKKRDMFYFSLNVLSGTKMSFPWEYSDFVIRSWSN